MNQNTKTGICKSKEIDINPTDRGGMIKLKSLVSLQPENEVRSDNVHYRHAAHFIMSMCRHKPKPGVETGTHTAMTKRILRNGRENLRTDSIR